MGDHLLRHTVETDMPKIIDLARRAELSMSSLESHWKRFVVVETDEGEIIGCGQLKPHIDGTRELASIAVAKPYRRQGVARMVVEHLTGQTSRPIYLICLSHMGPFYERFGFRSIGPAGMSLYFLCTYAVVKGVMALVGLARHRMPSERRNYVEGLLAKARGAVLFMRLDRRHT